MKIKKVIFGFFALILTAGSVFIDTAVSSEKLPVAKGQESSTDIKDPATTGSAGEYMERGLTSFRRGSFNDAITNYEQALRLYDRQKNRTQQCEALIMLSQASQMTGQYSKALQHLDRALATARELNDKRQTSATLGYIGNVYIGMGKGELAREYLNQGLLIAKESEYADVNAVIMNNLGNLYVSQSKYNEALDAYRESAFQAKKADKLSLAVQADINWVKAAMKIGKYADARSQLDMKLDQLGQDEDSYSKAYGLINAGLIYSDLRAHLPAQDQILLDQAYKALRDAHSVAQRINDQRTISYAYGYLGKLYEDEHQYKEALELTRLAVFAAQQQQATESLYRWHWQCGRILAHLGKIDDAILSYRLSVQDLNAVREEMSSCYADPESSYHKTASAVCRELVSLLLTRVSTLKEEKTLDAYLSEARETMEALKVFELREYFKDDCIDAASIVEKKLDVVSKNAVVIYPILLSDHVELLVSFSGRLKRFILPVSVEDLGKETRELRRMLEKRTTWEFLPHAQKLYDWIIRPIEKDLDSVKPDTLVFVPDGPLWSVPMSVLHDGKQFLINRYPIAITPGLNLTDPRPIKRENARVLALGLTESVRGFSGLPYVSNELKAIQKLYGGRILLNKEFRVPSMEKALQEEPFSIVHIASHGHFGGNVDDTFLLAFDEKFTMDRLGEYVGLFRFRDEPLDLITLSACETAAGDDRAALGLAGVSVRAGARSALATLWQVNDPASYELVVEFYKQLKKPSVSRAAALRAAQLKLLNDLRYDHPCYWAPFLLINNWL